MLLTFVITMFLEILLFLVLVNATLPEFSNCEIGDDQEIVTDFNSTHYYFIRCRVHRFTLDTDSCKQIKFYNNNPIANINISTTCDSKIYNFMIQQELRPNSLCEEGIETIFNIFTNNNYLFEKQIGCWESLKMTSYILTKNYHDDDKYYQLLTLDNTNDSIMFSPNILISFFSVILIIIFTN
jgi:hypothetical protein